MNLNDFPKWRFGANSIPGTAVNQIGRWRKGTFGKTAILRKPGWTAEGGMSVMPGVLSAFAFPPDEAGFVRRMKRYRVCEGERNTPPSIVLGFHNGSRGVLWTAV